MGPHRTGLARRGVPDLSSSATPGESRHSYAVLRGLTASTGAMVAAATTSLPERADQGRNYDYRYAWIRDQCYAGQAAAVIGDDDLLDSAVRFVSERILADGPDLRPAYTITGGRVPDQHDVTLPGYPGAPVRPATGSTTSSSSTPSARRCCCSRPLTVAAGSATTAVERSHPGRGDRKRQDEPDAGIWEIDNRRWAHSRLMCAAGLRAAARSVQRPRLDAEWAAARRRARHLRGP